MSGGGKDDPITFSDSEEDKPVEKTAPARKENKKLPRSKDILAMPPEERLKLFEDNFSIYTEQHVRKIYSGHNHVFHPAQNVQLPAELEGMEQDRSMEVADEIFHASEMPAFEVEMMYKRQGAEKAELLVLSDNDFEVRQSTMATKLGMKFRGLFCKKSYKYLDPVTAYKGRAVIDKKEQRKSDYSMEVYRPPLKKNERANRQVKGIITTIADKAKWSSKSRFANDCTQLNIITGMGDGVNMVALMTDGQPFPIFYALRDIQAGEELFLSYGISYWYSRWLTSEWESAMNRMSRTIPLMIADNVLYINKNSIGHPFRCVKQYSDEETLKFMQCRILSYNDHYRRGKQLPLVQAALHAKPKTMKYLLQMGCRPDQIEKGSNLDAMDAAVFVPESDHTKHVIDDAFLARKKQCVDLLRSRGVLAKKVYNLPLATALIFKAIKIPVNGQRYTVYDPLNITPVVAAKTSTTKPKKPKPKAKKPQQHPKSSSSGTGPASSSAPRQVQSSSVQRNNGSKSQKRKHGIVRTFHSAKRSKTVRFVSAATHSSHTQKRKGGRFV